MHSLHFGLHYRKEFVMSKNKSVQKKKVQSNDAADKHAAKKAAVLGTEKKSPLKMVSIIIVLALSIGGGIFFMSQRGKDGAIAVAPQSSGDLGREVIHPAGLFDDGQARYFQYTAQDGITVKYFVLKSSDGIIRAAFDACDVCWRAGKGYHQDGDFMVCGNCGRQFASVLVNVVQGGCNPAPLKRTITAGNVVIAVDDILEGKAYFNFSGKV
jgi:uncharacterized membrane protein